MRGVVRRHGAVLDIVVLWFERNELFCEVDEDYIQDDFNLSGLSSSVPYYDYALDTILDIDRPHSDITDQQQELMSQQQQCSMA